MRFAKNQLVLSYEDKKASLEVSPGLQDGAEDSRLRCSILPVRRRASCCCT